MSLRIGSYGKFAVLFAMLLFIGCAKESATNVQVFQYDWWMPIAVFFGGIVATYAGYSMLEAVPRAGWVLVALGPMAVIGVAPSMYRDRVVVSDEGFDVRGGLWGFSGQSVKFADTKEIRITSETQATRRGRSTTYYFNFDQKAGDSIKVPMSGRNKEAAVGAIIDAADAQGVPIRSEVDDGNRSRF